MYVILKGYFNHNFGDDFMVKTFIKQTPGIDYIIEEKNEYTSFLKGMPNVTFPKNCNTSYPSVTVTGSGFMVNSKNALKQELRNCISGRGKTDFCIGCNIEGFKGKLPELLIAKRLGNCKFITCRDKASYDWLKKMCPKTEIAYYPDILFSSSDISCPPFPGDGTLGITVMKTGNEEIDRSFTRNMAHIIDFYIQNTGRNVLLFAFSTGSENDYEVCEEIKNMAASKNNIQIICYSDDGTILLHEFSKCSKILAFRFHSAVLAMRLGIPMYPIIYRDKMRNLIKDMHYPVKGCHIENLRTDCVKDFLLLEAPEYTLPDLAEMEAGKHSQSFLQYLLRRRNFDEKSIDIS